MTRVGLADPCPLMRLAVKEVLRNFPEFGLAWNASNLDELERWMKRGAPQALILEPTLAVRSDVAVIERLHQQFPSTFVLVFTTAISERFTISALRAGAAGVLTKNCSANELVGALQRITAGKRYLSPAQAEQISLHFLSDASQRFRCGAVSPREREVLDGIIAGKRLKEIAADLTLSPKTIHTYKTRIMERFNLKSTADLIRFAEHDEPVVEASGAQA